ncbi:ECF transporter S component [Enterococcus sp. LJL90]
MKRDTQKFVLTAMFLAIMILLAVTPLGYINLGFMNATTMHIPVIIGSIILGPKIGGALGGVFGITSIIRNTVIPNPLSFAFTPFIPLYGSEHGSLLSLIVSILPRILIGVVPHFVFKALNKRLKGKKQPLTLGIAGVAGSLVNTILVMNLIYFLFQQPYSELMGEAGTALYGVILGVIFANGIPEAIVAGIATAAVTAVLFRVVRNPEF